ncbi:MAG: tetratricopeptide repeat protein [Candidatus Methanofastidiosia archaeon]
MNNNGNEPQTKREEGLMRQIEQAKNKGDIGLLNFLKSELAKHEKEYDIALEHCQEALNIDSENPKYLVQMGSILIKLRRFQNAIEFFDSVLEIDNENVDALKGKGWAYSRLRDNQNAIKCYNKVLELDLTDFEAWIGKGSALSYLGEYKEALKCFERVLDIEPDHYKVLKSKAFALSRLGKFENAIDIFNELLKRNPKDLGVIEGKATAYFYGKDPEKAIKLFEKALFLLERIRRRGKIEKKIYEGKKVNFLRKIGASLGYLEKDDEALQWFDKALEINPEDYNTLRDRGVSLSRLGRRKEALDYFEKALQINPENFPAWREKGAVLSNLNRDREAIRCYRKAIDINPDDYHSYRQLAASLAKIGRNEESEAILDIAIEINPNDVETLREKAFYYFKQFDDIKAEEYCEKVLEIEPNEPLTHLVLARIFEKREKFRISLLHYTKFRENATSQQKRGYLDQVNLRIEILEEWIQKEKEAPLPYDSVERIGIRFQGRYDDTVFKDMEEKEKKFNRFLTLQRSIDNTKFPSFLAILKRWNSYTPLLPLRGRLDKGGGYYLYHDGKGIVIDPGFNFIENFYQEGFNFVDIDAVIVTHAHIDHTMDLESILTLFDRINKNMKEKARKEAEKEGKNKEEIEHLYEEKVRERVKNIDLFLNKGTYQKYKALICCDKMTFIEGVYELEAGESLQLPEKYGNVTLFPMKAKHDEILDNEYCLGYVIDVDGKRIGITGDTGWEPDGSIGNQYKELSPDLMVTHIGSIKKKELEYANKTSQEEKNACFYSSHLGLNGVTKILEVVRPNLAIISEFGEELKDQRINIAQEIGEVIRVKCLPGDLGLYIRIPDLAVLCEVSKQFVPYEDIGFRPVPCILADNVKIPKICYYKKELPFEEVRDLSFNEEVRRKSLSKRIRRA